MSSLTSSKPAGPIEPRLARAYPQRRPDRRWRIALLAFLLGVVALGALLRFTYLDRKFYYGDEVISSLRESGHTEREFFRFFDGRVRTAADVTAVLADRHTSPLQTVESLAREDPQHPPLYYLLTRYWTQAWGDSTVSRRSLAACFGAAAIGTAFWLGWELFGSTLIAAVIAALVAVSPFNMIYSQQNREYSAWLCLIALVAALLLRALRGRGRAVWFAYALCLALGLYADSLMLFNVASFAIYVAVTERAWTTRARAFAVATAAALASYAPWLLVLYRGEGTVTGWEGPLRVAVSPLVYVLKWLFNIVAVFFDLEYEYTALAVVAALVLAALLASVVVFAWKAERQARLFVLLLALVPAVIFTAADILAHTSRATAPRYLIPTWLGLEIIMGFALGRLLETVTRPSGRAIAVAALVALIAGGLASDGYNLPSVATSATAEMGELGPEAQAINTARSPLVVSVHDGQHWDIGVAMLATVLRPSTDIQLFSDPSAIRLASHTGQLFLYEPNTATRRFMEATAKGRWHQVEVPPFGSPLVFRLRTRAQSDRAKEAVKPNTGSDVWYRTP